MRRWLPTLLVLLAGCGDRSALVAPSDPFASGPTAAGRIELSPSQATLPSLGDTVRFSARVFGPNGAELRSAPVTWESDRPNVATVDSAGFVRALAPGAVSITARSGGLSSAGRLTVQQVPTTLRLSLRADTLTSLGDTLRLSTTITDAGGSAVLGAVAELQSTRPSVVSVTPEGLVRAVAPGTALVVARHGPVADTAAFLVRQVAADVQVTPGAGTLTAVGDTVRLSASVADARGRAIAGAGVLWFSGAEQVATVDPDGLVHAVGPGTTTITATAGSAAAAANAVVTVVQVPTAVEVSPGSDTLTALGDTLRLSAVVRDRRGTRVDGTVVQWSSGSPDVVRVEPGGVAIALAPGTATLTAAAGGVSGRATVHVTQVAARVAVTPAADTLTSLGETVRLVATVSDARLRTIPGAPVTWTSLSPQVATVSGLGTVTAVAPGSAVITARVGDVSASSRITVTQVATGARVTPAADTIVALGDTVRLSASLADARGNPTGGGTFTWTVDDSTVARVDGAGLVTGLGTGAATVTASGGGFQATAHVTVLQVPTRIQVEPEAATLVALSDTVRIHADVFDARGNLVPNLTITWVSRTPQVATVSSTGLVTAVAQGTAFVTATWGSIRDTTVVTVEQVAASVDVTPAADTLTALGDTVRLSASAADYRGRAIVGTTFTWSSSDTAVARVDGTGLVTSVANGTALVSARHGELDDTARVTVLQAADGLTLTPATDTLGRVGDTVRFTAAVTDARGHPVPSAQVTWETGNPVVATVDATGLVTSAGAGTTTVVARSGSASDTSTVTVIQTPATLDVVPAEDTLSAVGDTLRLVAAVTDVDGFPIPDPEVEWTSRNPAVATVEAATGLVTAVGPGSTTVVAAAAEARDSAVVVVELVGLVLLGVESDTLVEGGTGVLRGVGFGNRADLLTVVVDGTVASVLEAADSTVRITVPSFTCRPTRGVEMRMVRSPEGGDTIQTFLRPASFDTPAVGELVVRSGSAACLVLPPTTGEESWLVGIQSVGDDPTVVTSVRLDADAGVGGVARPASPFVAAAEGPGPRALPTVRPDDDLLARHRRAEAAHRAREREMLEGLGFGRVQADVRAREAAARVPGVLAQVPDEGDVVTVRVPRIDLNTCSDFTTVQAVVKKVGTRGVWLEDQGNPTGGLEDADYELLSGYLDDRIYGVNSAYFGAPTDGDDNERILILLSQEVNRAGGVLGFVSSADLVDRTTCASSDEGEIYYSIAPDPAGTVGSAYTRAQVLDLSPILIAHEFTHIIQLGRRLALPGATGFQKTWELEGQATFAEEVNGHTFEGLAPGSNYGYSVAFNADSAQSYDWFKDVFSDLAYYYGFESGTSRVTGAPEQCTWIGRPSEGNDGPCGNADRAVYGTSAAFLRWISDHYGPGAGGEAALHRALVDNVFTGYATLEDVTGEDIETLLARWSASLYTDDRYFTSGFLSLPSWNQLDIATGLAETARLQPYTHTSFAEFTRNATVRDGSTAYVLVSGTGRPSTVLQGLTGAGATLPAGIQMWAVRVR